MEAVEEYEDSGIQMIDTSIAAMCRSCKSEVQRLRSVFRSAVSGETACWKGEAVEENKGNIIQLFAGHRRCCYVQVPK